MIINYEETLYVVEYPNDGMHWYACLEHAKDFATDNGLTWAGDYGYTEDSETMGASAWADTFGQVETDYPIGCEACDLDKDTKRTTWLGNRLTDDGVKYLLDPTRNFPLDVIKFYGYTAADIEKETNYYAVQWGDTGNRIYVWADSALGAINEAVSTYYPKHMSKLGAVAVRRAVLDEWKRELTISGHTIA